MPMVATMPIPRASTRTRTDRRAFSFPPPRCHDCLLDLSRIANRTADEPALDLTVVGRRVRKPALECVPLVARQRVADHSEPRIAWRDCAISPTMSRTSAGSPLWLEPDGSEPTSGAFPDDLNAV